MVGPCGQRTTLADGESPSTSVAGSHQGRAGYARAEQTEDRGRERGREMQNRQNNEVALHLVLHLSAAAATTAAKIGQPQHSGEHYQERSNFVRSDRQLLRGEVTASLHKAHVLAVHEKGQFASRVLPTRFRSWCVAAL